MKPSSYLLCSYPLGGKNASLENYDKEWATNTNKFHGHLREFTRETAEAFIPELTTIEIQPTHPPAYRNCLHILYQKKV